MPEKNDSTKPELLPCPFCGGKAEHAMYWHFASNGFGSLPKTHVIRCKKCRASTKEAKTKTTPVKNWNRRA